MLAQKAHRAVAFLAVMGVVACGEMPALQTEGPVPTERLQQELRSDNGIFLGNGLNLPNGFQLSNGLTLGNGLMLANGFQLSNGLTLGNGLISPPSGSDLEKWIDEDPTMKLRVLKYMVQCALAPTAVVTTKYRGASYTFQGAANLGPSWANGLMTVTEQERVSACLLARVNAKGELVQLNLFGPYSGMNTSNATEFETFPAIEGYFFGNLFTNPPLALIAPIGADEVCSYRYCKPAAKGCYCGVAYIALSGSRTVATIEGAPTYTDIFGNTDRETYAKELVVSGALKTSPDGQQTPVSWKTAVTFKNPVTVYLKRRPAGEFCNWKHGACQSNLCAQTRAGTVCQ